MQAVALTKQAVKDRDDIECILIIVVIELQSKLHHWGIMDCIQSIDGQPSSWRQVPKQETQRKSIV